MVTIKGRWRFADEAKTIGCGERGVNILIGRKWVRITERATGSRVKLRKSIYEELAPRRLLSVEA
jgi:hypothetical protein